MEETKLTYTAIDIGTFQVTSGKILVTDPCYTDKDPRHYLQIDVPDGKWSAAILKNEQDRVVSLTATLSESIDNATQVKRLKNSVGVDSGQCGFFDAAMFLENCGGKADEPDSFYGKCCAGTDDLGAAIIDDLGVVSVSGWGDGDYEVSTAVDRLGQAILVTISFIDPAYELIVLNLFRRSAR